MKNKILILLLPLFFSCESYFFSRPLPIDRPNLKSFPTAIRGEWYSEDGGFRFIDKHGIRLIINDTGSQLLNNRYIETRNDFKDAPPTQYIWKLTFDSIKHQYDTSMEAILKEGLVYGVSEDNELERGFPFELKQGALFYSNMDTVHFDLGNNVILRKIDDQLFVLNIRNSILGSENSWWQLVLIEIIDLHNMVYYYGLKDDHVAGDMKKFLVDPYYHSGSNYYFNVSWKANELKQLLKQGVFNRSDSLWR